MAGEALEGVKVADFGWVIVEPWTIKYLADHGAEVIRIESSKRIDPLRASGPYRHGIPNPDTATFFTIYNNNKYGVTLNLTHHKAVEIAKRIVSWADIVSEGYTPGTMERLGLGYEELRKIKPNIIMLSTCNLGQTGPYATHPGFGTQLVAYSGFASFTGWPDGEPLIPDAPYTDATAPLLAATAVIAALDYARRTGQGQHLDLSQHEASIQFFAPLFLDFTTNQQVANRIGNRCPYAAPHGAYRCQGEDRWCVVAVFSDEEWHCFCNVLGDPPWTKDAKFASLAGRKKNEDELDKLVEEWTMQFTAEQVMEMMQAAGVGAGVVQTSEDVYKDLQLNHRQHFEPLKHREIGEYNGERSAFRLSKTPAELRMPAPCLGQHNEYVYTKILGMSDTEFVELQQEGVFD